MSPKILKLYTEHEEYGYERKVVALLLVLCPLLGLAVHTTGVGKKTTRHWPGECWQIVPWSVTFLFHGPISYLSYFFST